MGCDLVLVKCLAAGPEFRRGLRKGKIVGRASRLRISLSAAGRTSQQQDRNRIGEVRLKRAPGDRAHGTGQSGSASDRSAQPIYADESRVFSVHMPILYDGTLQLTTA